MPDLHDDGLRPGAFYTVRTTRIIMPEEEVTVQYGEGYFTEEHPCACPDCGAEQYTQSEVPSEPTSDAGSSVPMLTAAPEPRPLKRRKQRGRKKLRVD